MIGHTIVMWCRHVYVQVVSRVGDGVNIRLHLSSYQFINILIVMKSVPYFFNIVLLYIIYVYEQLMGGRGFNTSMTEPSLGL